MLSSLSPLAVRMASTRCLASPAVGATISVPRRVLTISAGSRPTSRQCASRTSSLWRTVSASPKPFHMSAYCATSRSVRRSPPPPIMIFGPPGCTGCGMFSAPRTLWWRPSTVACGWENMARQIFRVSSSRSKRSATPGQSYPYASASAWFQAAPMPRTARPDETTSSVVTTLARNAGFRYTTPVTMAPSEIREVRAATPDSSV